MRGRTSKHEGAGSFNRVRVVVVLRNLSKDRNIMYAGDYGAGVKC